MSKTPLPPAPKQIAQFELVRRLGAGGMAEVFLAKKSGAEGTYKLLVLKRILPTHGGSRRFRAMFIEEARLAARLNHPNVVQVYEFQDFGDQGLLLAMEYVEGCDLGHLMMTARSKQVRIPPWIAAWITSEAAKGLHYAHEKKDEAGEPLEIVHRDVSPQNILLSLEGAVKIADFGIASARLFAEEQGVLKGKFGYMSPEQARGETVDRRSDLYALGVVFWEMLAGRHIHGGLGGEALLDIVRSGIVEPPSTHASDVPPELERIVLKTLSLDREERFSTGREMAAAIGKAIAKQGELIDSEALESSLGELVGRDARALFADGSEAKDSAALLFRSDDARTQAAVPLARSLADSRASPSSSTAGALAPAGSPSSRAAAFETRREVRHVAVLSLVLHGASGQQIARRMFDRLRGMLDDLAFKRGMQWAWTTDASGAHAQPEMIARAIAGLGAHSSRAAGDASQLAIDVHETVAGFKEDLPVPLAASIGIARGIAHGVRDAQGHLVQYSLDAAASYLADVLGRAAPAGSTWVAGGVYRLVRRDFRWGDLPSMKLASARDLELPVAMRIYSLERALSREERLDIQGGAADLVGRDAEKGDLHAAFHQAVSGRGGAGQLICRAIVGEMGIGKTALVATFLAELPPNARMLHVECTPVTGEVPYAAVADLVRQSLGTSGEEPFDEVVALIAKAGGGSATGDASSPMVARLAELATNRRIEGRGDEDAHARRKQIVSGIRNLLAIIALAQPLVLVVDGLHWCDKASLDVLGEAIQAKDPVPIFVLLVTRPEERVAHTTEGLIRIELRGLTPDEQIRLVETRLGVTDGVRQVCAELLPKVGDNPFFLLEMVDALLERGALEIRERTGNGADRVSTLARTVGEDVGLATLPSTLEQLLGDRLRELPAAEHVVVDWLAIAGGPLSLSDVLKLTQQSDDEALVRLCARGLCDRKGELVDFRHPITREVGYAALEEDDRVKMHRAIGEHLAGTSLGRGLSAAIVARHLARGRSYERAAEFYFEAGAAARASYQTRLAIRYYLRANSHLRGDDKRRFVAHEALENAYRMLGRRRERQRHLKALRLIAKHLGTPRAVCLGLLRSARYDFDEGRLPRGVVAARQAAQIARASHLPVFEMEAEARVSEFLRELGEVQGALLACDRALKAFEPAHADQMPPRQRGEVLRQRGMLLIRMGRVNEAVEAYVDAIAIFKKCGARRLEARAKGALSYAMFVQGRYEDAIALSLESVQIDLSIGVRFQIARALTNAGHAYFRLGDVGRSLVYLQRARDVHERYGDQNGWAETLLVSAAVSAEMGDLDAAEGFVRDAGALTAVTENAYDRTHESVVRAFIGRARGRPEEALKHAVDARRSAEQMGLAAFNFYALAMEASARAELGEIHVATLVATSALGAVENLQGCEYGLEVRVLCAEVLARGGSRNAVAAKRSAMDYAKALAGAIRDPRLRKLFTARSVMATLVNAKSGSAVEDEGAKSLPEPASRGS